MTSEHVTPSTRYASRRRRPGSLTTRRPAASPGSSGCSPTPPGSRILYALDLVDELCVGDLALALEATDDSVGYALRVLRTAGLVSTRKEGRVVYYRFSQGFPEPLRDHCLRALVDLSRTVAHPDDKLEERP